MDDYQVIALFCDDIREERASKTTLVGIYGDNVNVPNIPSAFPKIALYVRLHMKPDFDLREFSVVLRFPKGDEVKLGDVDKATIEKAKKQAAKDSPYVGVVLNVVFAPAPIEMAGRIVAVAIINGREHVVSGLNVQLKPTSQNPTALPQPSEQSESVS
jgi:hypothetical protein